MNHNVLTLFRCPTSLRTGLDNLAAKAFETRSSMLRRLIVQAMDAELQADAAKAAAKNRSKAA